MKQTSHLISLKTGLLMLAAILLGLPVASYAQQTSPRAVDPKADEVLKKTGETLKSATSISFVAHAMVDQLLPDGEKVQYAKNQKATLRRPDRIAAEMAGDLDDLQLRYDGKEVTLFNPRTNSYGSAAAPGTIDETLDMLAEKYGMIMPLADLAFSDPYKVLIENARSGQYIGMGYVFETKCHHLAFRSGAVDWQIWIEDGEKALPRKVVITFKDSPGYPQYTAFLSDWNLSAKTDDSAFTFTPPAGAKKVDFAPTTQPSAAPEKP